VTSSAGLLAATGYLTRPDGSLGSLAVARGRQRAIIADGSAATGAGPLLCRWDDAASPRTLVVTDQLWRRFVSGDSLGDSCPNEPAKALAARPARVSYHRATWIVQVRGYPNEGSRLITHEVIAVAHLGHADAESGRERHG
jgi:hypothetical protein